MDDRKENFVLAVNRTTEIVSGFVTTDLQYNAFLTTVLSGYANLASGNTEPIVVSLQNPGRGKFVEAVELESGQLDPDEVEAARKLFSE